MSSPIARMRLLLILMIAIFGSLPIAAYWIFLGRVPTATPEEAKDILSKPDSGAVLVDVRAPEEFKANHLEAAINWPYEDIVATGSPDAIPEQFKGKALFLICNSGIQSALAVQKLQELSRRDAKSVRGGMQAWVASAERPCTLGLCRVRTAAGTTAGLPFRESPLWQQWAVFLNAVAFKPSYMLLSLVLAAVLWRAKSPDLVALRWALLFFFIGEAFCMANYYVYRDASYLFENFHSFGMVLNLGFVTFAVFEGMDSRLVKYRDPDQKCAALGLCRACFKYTHVPCGLKRLFLYLTPACIILCFMPLTAEPHAVSYNTRIMGVLYNYSHPTVDQLYEIRCCPVFAIPLFTVAFLILLLKKEDPVSPSKVFFAAGMGYLGFAFFRLFLFTPYRDDLIWFVLWEEITEMIYVVGVGFVLWVFRDGLFPKSETA